MAEVYGDLASAERTAVVVPGSDIDLATFDRKGKNRYGTPAGMADSLTGPHGHRRSPSTRTAVIAWVGYTTPVGLGPDAATARLADAGAPRLERFLHGLAAHRAFPPRRSCATATAPSCAGRPRTG